MEKNYKIVPFDVNRINEEGVKVVTRDGRIARIICIDALGDKPIVALVTTEGENFEIPYDYAKNGKRFNNEQSDADLFLQVPIKQRRMTNQELSWWLRDCPEEHRELKSCLSSLMVWHSHSYSEPCANDECQKDILIRSNGGEWKDPLVEEE